MKEKKFKVILVFRFISSFKCQFLCWFKVYPHQVIYTKKTEYPKLLTESRAGDKSPPPWPQQLSIFLKSLSDFYLGKVAFFFNHTENNNNKACPCSSSYPQGWSPPGLDTSFGNNVGESTLWPLIHVYMVGTGISLPEPFPLPPSSQGRDLALWAATGSLTALKSCAQTTVWRVKSGYKTKMNYNRDKAHGEENVGSDTAILFTHQPI